MFVDLLYALCQLSFLGFVVALVKHHRCAWGFLMLSCLIKISNMQDLHNINLSYLHYYIAEFMIIIISMLGYISYNIDYRKNLPQKLSIFKKMRLFMLSVSLALVIYYVLIYIITKVTFSMSPIFFGLHFLEYLFTVFALLLAIYKSPFALVSLAVAFITSMFIQAGLLFAIPNYLVVFFLNVTYSLTLTIIVLVAYKRNKKLTFQIR